ncbi:hypothetical protein T492DRAFT_857846 [Pavlovales sp. CCMP2436]|nr:hypothetical protein T492DRAFT_857846 [Pavlovales sp. CCMP2436]
MAIAEVLANASDVARAGTLAELRRTKAVEAMVADVDRLYIVLSALANLAELGGQELVREDGTALYYVVVGIQNMTSCDVCTEQLIVHDYEPTLQLLAAAVSLLVKTRRVKHPAERAAATEDDASATLSQTLEEYGLPLKTKVPEEELTHDPNVDGGGILQAGSAIRSYTLGHIGRHKGDDGKYLGVADLLWLVKMLNALKDTDGYPRCDLSGFRFTWNSEGEWSFSLNRIDNKDPSHGEKNVELTVAHCNAVECESYGAMNLRTSFTDMFKQMLREFTEPTLERLNDEEDVIARVKEIFGGYLEGRKRIFDNIARAADHDKKFITQRGRCAYTGILMNGSSTSPFCVSLERLNNEICNFSLKLDELGKPNVDFSNVVWIMRLIQVQSSWSRRITLAALLSSPTLERTCEQEKLIMDALSVTVA